MSRELVLFETKPSIGIEKHFNAITISFHSEEEAEKFYIAFVEADRNGSEVKIKFGGGTNENQ